MIRRSLRILSVAVAVAALVGSWVHAAGHRRRLTPRFARLRFDPLRSARRANIAARRAAPAADGSTTVDGAPWVRFSERSVAAFGGYSAT